eukprot:15474963-Alexandrium_andersonii.AAC.1
MAAVWAEAGVAAWRSGGRRAAPLRAALPAAGRGARARGTEPEPTSPTHGRRGARRRAAGPPPESHLATLEGMAGSGQGSAPTEGVVGLRLGSDARAGVGARWELRLEVPEALRPAD